MNAWTPLPSDALPHGALTGAADDAACTQAQLWMLGRLAEMGLRIVEAIERQATREPTPDASDDAPLPDTPFPGDLALAFSRVSRAIRLSIALQARLMAERREAATADATQSRMAAVRDRPSRRARIERIVERLAREAHDGDGEAVERCLSETAERLEDVDVFGDVLSRPVSETIALICRELGLSPDWPALAQEAWAREEIAAGEVGAPLRAALSSIVIPETAQRLSGTQQLPPVDAGSRVSAPLRPG